jgi:hypothetical protein
MSENLWKAVRSKEFNFESPGLIHPLPSDPQFFWLWCQLPNAEPIVYVKSSKIEYSQFLLKISIFSHVGPLRIFKEIITHLGKFVY